MEKINIFGFNDIVGFYSGYIMHIDLKNGYCMSFQITTDFDFDITSYCFQVINETIKFNVKMLCSNIKKITISNDTNGLELVGYKEEF